MYLIKCHAYSNAIHWKGNEEVDVVMEHWHRKITKFLQNDGVPSSGWTFLVAPMCIRSNAIGLRGGNRRAFTPLPYSGCSWTDVISIRLAWNTCAQCGAHAQPSSFQQCFEVVLFHKIIFRALPDVNFAAELCSHLIGWQGPCVNPLWYFIGDVLIMK